MIEPYAIVGNGGTSLGTEEIMKDIRGLVGKINKATEPKRTILQFLVNYVDDNKKLINANLSGETAEQATQRLGREITKKMIDNTYHPKNVIFGAQVPYITLLQWYIQCLGGEGRTPDLYQRGVISR